MKRTGMKAGKKRLACFVVNSRRMMTEVRIYRGEDKETIEKLFERDHPFEEILSIEKTAVED